MPHKRVRQSLTQDSELGLYESQITKALYWKVNEEEVLLISETGPHQQFQLIDLSASSIDQVYWTGQARLRVGQSVYRKPSSKVGYLVRKLLRLYVVALTSHESYKQVLIEDILFQEIESFLEYYHAWDLAVTIDGEDVVVFTTPTLLPAVAAPAS